LLLVIGGLVFLWIGDGPWWVNSAVIAVISATIFWSVSSLLVSHYVYDRSGLYRFDWLKGLFKLEPRRWANIHAGLDETSIVLRNLFPKSTWQVLDIYDAQTITEPSIKRARMITTSEVLARPASYHSLLLDDASCDTVFVIFTAHELRQAEARRAFFSELHRVLESCGSVILVEHLRDLANLIAFGPGFWHFLPRNEWLNAARKAGFAVVAEIKITPFVRAFHFGRR